MIDHNTEDMLTLSEACNESAMLTRRNGKAAPASMAKMHRLVTLGQKRADGERVVLESRVWTDGRRWTSRQAIERFIAEMNGETPPPPPAATARRQQQKSHAAAQLDAAGVF